MTEPLVISVEDAARMLGISRGLAYEAARTGAIPALRIGRRLLVPRARLLELVGASDFGGNGHASPEREEVTATTRQAETFAGKGEAGDHAPASSPVPNRMEIQSED